MYIGALFPIADTFQTPITKGKYGPEFSDHCLAYIGPWKASFYMDGYPDVNTVDSSGMLVKFRKSLWAYVVSFLNKAGTPAEVFLVLFDGKQADIHLSNVYTWGCGDLAKTMNKIGPAAKQVLRYDLDRWVECNVRDLDERIAAQGDKLPSTHPEEPSVSDFGF